MIPMMNPLGMMGQSSDPFSLLGSKSGLAYTKPGSWTLAGLQAASTYAGTLAQIGAIKANAQRTAQQTELQMRDEALNATQAEVSGFGQVAGLRKSLSQILGQRAALAGASGVDVGQGMVADNARAITADNDTAAGVFRSNAEIMSRRHQINQLALALGNLQTQDAASREVQATRDTGLLSALLGVGSTLLAPLPKG